VRDLFGGAACLVRGLTMFVGTPSLWLIGLVPALLALFILIGLLVGLFLALPAVGNALTSFASTWSAGDRATLRVLVELALAVAAAWLALVSYTALTVAIGQPFYETISRRVEAREGGEPAPPRMRWWRSSARAVRDGLLLVALTAGFSVVLVVLGFVPLIGETVVPAIGACVTAFFLSLELTSLALERRGLRLGDRLRLLWRRRLLAIGFGLAVFILFLVPLGAVVGMPGAVAGGTLLARRLTGQPHDRVPDPVASCD
jgi:CysZ protein